MKVMARLVKALLFGSRTSEAKASTSQVIEAARRNIQAAENLRKALREQPQCERQPVHIPRPQRRH